MYPEFVLLYTSVHFCTRSITGFDDKLLPAVLGALGVALTAANHRSAGADLGPAQLRAEALGLAMAAACLALPGLGDAAGVRDGRRRSLRAKRVDGAVELFELAAALTAAQRAELAWSSFALLKNTAACSLVVAAAAGSGGGVEAVCARGAFAPAAAGAEGRQCEALTALLGGGLGARLGAGEVEWADRGALERAGERGGGALPLAFVPAGAQYLLAVPLRPGTPGAGFLAVLSDEPAALTAKDRKWVRAVAEKVGAALEA